MGQSSTWGSLEQSIWSEGLLRNLMQAYVPVYEDRVERRLHFLQDLEDAGKLALEELTGSVRSHPRCDGDALLVAFA